MTSKITKGAEFLVKITSQSDVFTPEDFSEEQLMLRDTIKQFIDREVFPKKPEFEKKNYQLTVEILKKTLDLGLLGVSVPQAYGGLGMGFTSTILVADYISGATGSLATAFGAHTGIGTMPIVLYGNEAQKQKYVPKLISGECFGAYCLTEPSAGSDANSGKTRADLSEDGTHYILNGQKMWISNAGFAGLFTVFARIADDKYITGFIVENDPSNGITLGEEEHKLGIRSSSTRQVFFNNTKVPLENMLSERQSGFKIALNTLNIGRIKLAAGTLDAQRRAINEVVKYANQRVQFGVPISHFGAVKAKFANMATALYVCESACYRTAKGIENTIESNISKGIPDQQAELKGVEDYALECSILKIACSEDLQNCTDEGIQIFGGMGFSEDTPMESFWRDSRITRIYEGTNEINRMLCINLLVKKCMKGELDLMTPMDQLAKEIEEMGKNQPEFSEILAQEQSMVENFKKTFLMVFGYMIKKYEARLEEHQELLLAASDILIQTYMVESALLRALKNIERFGEQQQHIQTQMVKLAVYKASEKIHSSAMEVIVSFPQDAQRPLLLGLKKLTTYLKYPNLTEIRQSIADKIIEQNKYPI